MIMKAEKNCVNLLPHQNSVNFSTLINICLVIGGLWLIIHIWKTDKLGWLEEGNPITITKLRVLPLVVVEYCLIGLCLVRIKVSTYRLVGKGLLCGLIAGTVCGVGIGMDSLAGTIFGSIGGFLMGAFSGILNIDLKD